MEMILKNVNVPHALYAEPRVVPCLMPLASSEMMKVSFHLRPAIRNSVMTGNREVTGLTCAISLLSLCQNRLHKRYILIMIETFAGSEVNERMCDSGGNSIHCLSHM